MLLGGEGEPGVVALAAVGGDDEGVEENFAEAVGRAVAAREDAHRPVAVAGEGRLEDGRGELHMADRGRREGPRWRCLEWDRVSQGKSPAGVPGCGAHEVTARGRCRTNSVPER